jgi:hypothetical protein
MHCILEHLKFPISGERFRVDIGRNASGDSIAHIMADLQPAEPEQADALDEARRLAALAFETGLVHRRPVPLTTNLVASAVPDWANGLKASSNLGPFKDLANRDVWIDLFPIVRHIRLVRVAGGIPFMTLPIEIIIPVPFPPPPSPTLDMPAGSVWFASQLLDASAPAGSWTGIRVAGGTLRFSAPVTGTGGEIVVPFGVTVDLTVDTAPQPRGTGTGPGQDARDANVAVPARFRLLVGSSAELTVDPADTARLLAFGFDTTLTPANGPVVYDPALKILAVPFTAQTSPFTVNSVKATAFSLAGAAPITAAAWGLPVAVIDPASLGDASGTGSLVVRLEAGLSGTWLGQTAPMRLMAAVLVADPLSLAVLTGDAQGERVEQQPRLPASEKGHLGLRWRTTFPIAFVAEAKGVEGVVTEAELSAVFDRPVDLRGERLSLHTQTIAVLFLATAQGTFLLTEGPLPPGLYQHAIGFGLVNAVLRATPPAALILYGAYDGTTLDQAAVLLEYRLLALVPTLPDPYAASYGSILSAIDQPGGGLVSILEWGPAASSFDFRIIPGAGEGILSLSRPRDEPFQAEQSPSALVERSGIDLWPEAVKAVGGALSFERSQGLILLDVSTNVDQFGVAWGPSARREAAGSALAIENLTLKAEGGDVLLVTLPAVQWEAVETVQDPGPDPLPRWVDFANSGVPTVFTVPTTSLVPVYPTAALTTLIDNFAQPAPLITQARFTLPFGIIALSSLHGPAPGNPRSATVAFNRPAKGQLQGAHQLRIDAHDATLPSGETPAFDGYTVQLPVAQPGNRSVLGDDVTSIFNTYLGASGTRPMVPVTRIDVSGYGESLFSDWRNPYTDPVAVAQARFDVMVGRTAYEIIQVRSILFPYGAVVVRTITIERRNNAIVTRSDSGWRAVSDGVYQFPGSPIVTHPGVVTRITEVTNILDTGQVLHVGGVDMAAVYFDGDLILDGAPANPGGGARPAPAKGQFGFIQITAGALIGPGQYADLLTQAGSLGGPLDTSINVGSGPQVIRLQRVDVGVTQGMGGPEFVMAAWGAPAFPGGGQWSVVQIDSPASAPAAVPQDRGLPLIRAGAAGAVPSPTSPYRFADPADLAQPSNPGRDYAVLHAMGTQRALFPRPKIEATDPTRITSTQIGTVADPYSLGTAIGPYPGPDKTVPFPTSAWALEVDANGQYKLGLPSPFAAGVGRRTMRQAGSVRSDLDYSAARVTYDLDTSQAVPWHFRLDGAVKIMNTTSLGDVIQLRANVVAVAGAATRFEQPNLVLGGGLSIVQDLLTILADLGITGTMSALMTNDWALKVAEIVPIVDASGKSLQIPPLPDPSPDLKFDETEIKVEIQVAPSADKAAFSMGGQPLIKIHALPPNVYAVAIIKFQIEISTADGTVYSLLIGFGLAYSLDAPPFGFKGLFALTLFGLIGDTVLGFGIGFLLQLQASIEPIVQVTISLEGQLAIVDACRGTPNATEYGAAKLTFGVEVSVCLVFSISIEVSTTGSEVLSGPGGAACPLPDVLPNAS